jgi:ABC-type nickel/cobalt efflux system permease component RcnA
MLLKNLEVTGSVELKPLLLTAFATGLVPCPGAALILIFTITQHILFAGLMAMVCMAVGMGATTSAFALVAIASRHSLFRLTAHHKKLFMLSHTVLSISGALVIIAIGTLLLLR